MDDPRGEQDRSDEREAALLDDLEVDPEVADDVVGGARGIGQGDGG